MLPRSSAISVPLSVVVEVLNSSVLLVLRQLKSVASTASEFTFGSPTSTRATTVKVRPTSTVSILSMYKVIRNACNYPVQYNFSVKVYLLAYYSYRM